MLYVIIQAMKWSVALILHILFATTALCLFGLYYFNWLHFMSPILEPVACEILRAILPEAYQNFLCHYSCAQWSCDQNPNRIPCRSVRLSKVKRVIMNEFRKKIMTSWMKPYMCRFVCKHCYSNGKTAVCHRQL